MHRESSQRHRWGCPSPGTQPSPGVGFAPSQHLSTSAVASVPDQHRSESTMYNDHTSCIKYLEVTCCITNTSSESTMYLRQILFDVVVYDYVKYSQIWHQLC